MNFVPLTKEQKAELGIALEHEVFIVEVESQDWCGISETYAVALPSEDTEDTILNFIGANYDGVIYDDMAQYYDEDDLEETEGEVNYSAKLVDASEWEFSWLDNSCQKLNF